MGDALLLGKPESQNNAKKQQLYPFRSVFSGLFSGSKLVWNALIHYGTLYTIGHFASIVLAALTIIALCVLVCIQAVNRRNSVRDARRRKELFAVALEYLEEPEFISAFKKQLKGRDERLLVRVFVDLLSKVKGEYADSVVHLMKELGIQEKSLADLRSKKWWRRAEASVALG
ncbi:MAG: hypothetical protein CMO80_21025 [Verrucomicrobiales bacterium]|nr:hypothetical protein [Verrucomicrobiales bacterium]|tara:strand:- start:100 stop:618 length:519 start_codon:yes stop_codon:yes gene_type:complete